MGLGLYKLLAIFLLVTLNSLGLNSNIRSTGYWISNGPSGGYEGTPFSHTSIINEGVNGIQQIAITTYSDGVGIAVIYKLRRGVNKPAVISGQSRERGDTRLFDLDEGEYITEVYGSYERTINQIWFKTNKKTSFGYGPISIAGRGTKFRFEAPRNCSILGFFGNASEGKLVALGVYNSCD